MKRFTLRFSLSALSVMLMLSLVSCGPKDDDSNEKPTAPVAVVENTTNETVLEGISKARQLALDSGAETKAPDKLEQIDGLYADIKTRAEKGEDIITDGKDVSDRYLALAAYLSAKDAKEKIDGTQMSYLAQSLYDEGCAALADLEDMYAEGESTGSQLLAKATTASTSLNTVLATIYKKLAKQERDAAMEAKKDADSVKAGVAMRDEYNSAVETFKDGDKAYTMQRPDKAYDNYVSAKETFKNLFEEVSAKRAAAQKAIEEAKKRVEESANYAEVADEQAPITESMEGIEDEDAVLLEKDTYQDPAEAEASLPDDVEDPVADAISGALKSGDAK